MNTQTFWTDTEPLEFVYTYKEFTDLETSTVEGSVIVGEPPLVLVDFEQGVIVGELSNIFEDFVIAEHQLPEPRELPEPNDRIRDLIDITPYDDNDLTFYGMLSRGEENTISIDFGDVDLYPVQLEAGELLTIQTTPETHSGEWVNLINLKVLDSEGNDLAISKPHANSLKLWVNQTGTYYVGVTGLQSETTELMSSDFSPLINTYKLSINVSSGVTDETDYVLANCGPDFIASQGGNDFIDGAGGRDTIKGGQGNDTLAGGDGRDRLFGGNDADFLKGEEGEDFIKGQKGNDIIFGGSGDDSLIGGKGKDKIEGGDGNDTLVGVDNRALNVLNLQSTQDNLGLGCLIIDPLNDDGDILMGGDGRDTFVLGDFYRTYYSSESSSQCQILDFNPEEDEIILGGVYRENYRLEPNSGADGIDIVYGSKTIATLMGVSSDLNLNSSYFHFEEHNLLNELPSTP